MPKYILGLSCFYHDSAAGLIKDGNVIAAAQEERFSRTKFDESFPVQAVEYCLKEAGITVDQLDAVVFYEKPLIHFHRILITSIQNWPFSFGFFVKALIVWMQKKLWFPFILKWYTGYSGKIFYSSHHLSHAASAYYPSGFSEAAVLTIDAVGEWETLTIWQGSGNQLTKKAALEIPNSLGLLYSTMTGYLGFRVNSAEYKVMGLAPYGKDTYVKQLRKLLIKNKDGSFQLNTEYFTYTDAEKMYTNKLTELLGFPPRTPDQKLEQHHMDAAKSLQTVLEESLEGICEYVKKVIVSDNLAYAGGVALNCVANSNVLKKYFKNIYVQPAAGDAGGAVGCALYYYFAYLNHPLPKQNPIESIYLGPAFSDKEIARVLKKHKIKADIISSSAKLLSTTAALIDQQKVIGWFQGRMEFGPRALGNRSIIADPRNKENWQRVNLKIKYRESFRPFAPSVPLEDVSTYFKWEGPAPYMLFTADVKVKNIPAVTHVDKSARLQTVSKKENPLYHGLMMAYKKLTGCSVIINTSFNVRGEPIVCSPTDAVFCFFNTEMDVLVMNNYVITKESNKHLSKKDFERNATFID